MKWTVPVLVLAVGCSADGDSSRTMDVNVGLPDSGFGVPETTSPIACSDPTCDDGNPCTMDRCVGTVCEHQVLDLVCDDENPCTIDECFDGACQHSPATGFPCDDLNACTESSTCSVAGICDGGTSVTCDSDNPCEIASCSPDSGCISSLVVDGALCNDGNSCTIADACVAGVCMGITVSCTPDNACVVHTGCTSAGDCVFEPAPDNTTCDDGNKCTIDDQCQDGTCFSGTAIECNDANPCTDDKCKPKSGCEFALPLKTTPCNDGSSCTSNDECKNGQCSGQPINCDDGDPCTEDSCLKETGCQNTWNTSPCPAGSLCVLGATCKEGKCISGTKKNCDDANACTNDSCEPSTGDCIHTAAAFLGCDDNNPCTDNDQCSDTGLCMGSPKVCNGVGECTQAKCNVAIGGCVSSFAPDNAPCTTEQCGFSGVCKSGICTADAAPDSLCNDNNPCTDDVCDPAKGCVYANNTSSCTDNNLCTENDTCIGGACKGANKNCTDGLPCTDDFCNPKLGCEHPPNQAPCDDGDGCTQNDQCNGAGLCIGFLKITVCGPCAGENQGCPPEFTCTSGACVGNDEVYVPAGPFYRGCNAVPAQTCTSSELPAHMVNVPAFIIDRYEVSVASFKNAFSDEKWQTLVGSTSTCNAWDPAKSAHPINCVSRDTAVDHCNKFGKRLCSEAEWEKAARGGCEFYDNCETDTPPYPWGTALATCQWAVLAPTENIYGCGTDTTFPVGSKPEGKSPYGCEDVSGNAWEWVADCWHNTLASAPTDGSLWDEPCADPTIGTIRGGGYKNTAKAVKTYTRDFATALNNQNLQIGFRCCRNPKP